MQWSSFSSKQRPNENEYSYSSAIQAVLPQLHGTKPHLHEVSHPSEFPNANFSEQLSPQPR